MNMFGNALWQLVVQSDLVSKLVLLILLVMSIACWAIFFYKLMLLNVKKRQMEVVLNEVKKIQDLQAMLPLVSAHTGTIAAYFISRNLMTLKSVISLEPGLKSQPLTERQEQWVTQNVDTTIDELIAHEESYLSFLSTCTAISPLLGLFGTVWGLVHAFIRISEKQAADITVVAPGIAEALITTLAGLMVAIPALVMFNVLVARIKKFESQLIQLADRFNTVVSRLVQE